MPMNPTSFAIVRDADTEVSLKTEQNDNKTFATVKQKQNPGHS